MALSIITAPATLRKIGGGWSIGGSGGNSRGEAAVDLQTVRAQEDQVASGTCATVGGGARNTASAPTATIGGGYANTASRYNATIGGGAVNTASAPCATIGGGYANTASNYSATIGGGMRNTASGTYASTVAGGQDNTASGMHAAVGGGYNNVASGAYSAIAGGVWAKSSLRGQHAQAAGRFSTRGDAQTSVLVARTSTYHATPSEICLDGEDATERCVIAADTTWAFDILVVARCIHSPHESAAYHFHGCIANTDGTTALVGSVAKTVIAEERTAWDCNVTADDANDALIMTATGEVGRMVRWVARIELVETTG